MKGRAHVMPAIAAVLLVLLSGLAWLQYQWLGRISEAERDRMQATLRTRASQFADDFDRIITRAYFEFQLVADNGLPGAEAYAERYRRWLQTGDEALIRAIYRVSPTEGHLAIARFDPDGGTLDPAEWPDELRPWRDRMIAGGIREGPPPLQASGPVLDDPPALVIPVPRLRLMGELPPPGRSVNRVELVSLVAHTIILLDRDHISRELLPALSRRYFDGDDGLDYQVAVLSGTGAVLFASHPVDSGRFASPDATAQLLTLRLDEADHPRGEPAAARLAVSVLQQRVVAPGSQTFIRVAGPAPRWQLLLKHQAGSLEAAVEQARRRNLVISMGVLLLLGASVLLMAVSAQRAHRLAIQQMEFVAAVSHELRTPLAVIRSAGDNLAQGVIDQESRVRRYGELVRNEGRRLSEMVEQILELSGIESGQRGFAGRPLALRSVVEDVLERSQALVEQAGLEVEVDLAADLPDVLGDEPALRRALQNLVANAVKYGRDGGWMGIRARASGRDVRLSVADRGIGIAAADQARIFEPFYRAADVVAAQYQGAGLGLSLVKRIVEAHGGRITVRSAPGQGSEFTLHLPAATGQQAAATAGVPAPTPHHS